MIGGCTVCMKPHCECGTGKLGGDKKECTGCAGGMMSCANCLANMAEFDGSVGVVGHPEMMRMQREQNLKQSRMIEDMALGRIGLVEHTGDIDTCQCFMCIEFRAKQGRMGKDLAHFMLNGTVPNHYNNGGEDYIDRTFRTGTEEEIRGAIKFSIGKYVDRLGKKDDEVKELAKIIDYATRYKTHLEKELK